MSSRAGDGQFVAIDFRLLEDPRYCAFMRSAAFATYMVLRRYVWRSRRRPHLVARVNELFEEGYLVCALPRKALGEKLGLTGLPTISRHVAELEELGVIQKVTTGRENVYVLGTWEDKSAAGDGSCVVETFFQEQLFGGVPAPRASRVSPTETSEVSRMKPYNKEGNKEENPAPRGRGCTAEQLAGRRQARAGPARAQRLYPRLAHTRRRRTRRTRTVRTPADGDASPTASPSALGKPCSRRSHWRKAPSNRLAQPF